MARNLDAQWQCVGNQLTPIHQWHASEIVIKTAILAKANALVHCGDLLAQQPGRLPAFAAWLNQAFRWRGNTALGSLEDRAKDAYDIVITNPPFVVSGSADVAKLIKNDNARKTYFSRKGTGLEALFIQFIIQGLKANGHAWVLLPETFFLRTTDSGLRNWMLEACKVDLLASLPERTFFNTPKRVVIVHMTKRPTPLAKAGAAETLAGERTLLFAVSEIGETRDAKRLPERSDLPELVRTYKLHKAGVLPNTERAVAVPSGSLYGLDSINIRHHWPADVARKLGLLGAEEDPLETRREIDAQVRTMRLLALEWRKESAKLVAPPNTNAVRTVKLAELDAKGRPLKEQSLFDLRIGKRVLKKEVHKVTTGVKLYSANIRHPFGFVTAANAGGLEYGGALWSIDSDFDCRHVAPGEAYSITDHCGQIAIKVPDIDPAYLAAQVRQAGLDNGFNRDFRPSLELMYKLEITLPVKEDGSFDLELMQAWSAFREKLELFKQEMAKLAE